jgi:hypothetical protein
MVPTNGPKPLFHNTAQIESSAVKLSAVAAVDTSIPTALIIRPNGLDVRSMCLRKHAARRFSESANLRARSEIFGHGNAQGLVKHTPVADNL